MKFTVSICVALSIEMTHISREIWALQPAFLPFTAVTQRNPSVSSHLRCVCVG